MATRQYIGARYVIKIYENSLDPSSAEWEANVNYEPLTMVTYNNGSYLSKKEIPASVGDPASNPSYWVQTGFYNGQITSLQNQIDQINNTTIPALVNDIDTINNEIRNIYNRKFVFIVDSYGNRTDINGNTIEQILEANGLDIEYYIAISGGGFTTPITANNFKTHLSDYTGDYDEITDVVFCGGANDNNVSFTAIQNSVEDCLTEAQTLYPNAKIHIVPWGVGMVDAAWAQVVLADVAAAYTLGGVMKRAFIAKNAQYMLRNTTLLESDGIHPNASGVAYIAKMIYGYLQGNEIDVYHTLTAHQTLVDTTNISNATLSDIVMTRHNGNVTLSCSGGGGFMDFDHTASSGSFSSNPAISLDDTLVSGTSTVSTGFISAYGRARKADNTGYIGATVKFKILGKNIRLLCATSGYDSCNKLQMLDNVITYND